jgi:hypothetical protein
VSDSFVWLGCGIHRAPKKKDNHSALTPSPARRNSGGDSAAKQYESITEGP